MIIPRPNPPTLSHTRIVRERNETLLREAEDRNAHRLGSLRAGHECEHAPEAVGSPLWPSLGDGGAHPVASPGRGWRPRLAGSPIALHVGERIAQRGGTRIESARRAEDARHHAIDVLGDALFFGWREGGVLDERRVGCGRRREGEGGGWMELTAACAMSVRASRSTVSSSFSIVTSSRGEIMPPCSFMARAASTCRGYTDQNCSVSRNAARRPPYWWCSSRKRSSACDHRVACVRPLDDVAVATRRGASAWSCASSLHSVACVSLAF